MAKEITIPAEVEVTFLKSATAKIDLSKVAGGTDGVVTLLCRALRNLGNDRLAPKGMSDADAQKAIDGTVAAWLSDPAGATREADSFRDALRAVARARKLAKPAVIAAANRAAVARMLIDGPGVDVVYQVATLIGVDTDECDEAIEAAAALNTDK